MRITYVFVSYVLHNVTLVNATLSTEDPSWGLGPSIARNVRRRRINEKITLITWACSLENQDKYQLQK